MTHLGVRITKKPINKPTIQHKLQVDDLFGNEEEDPFTSNPATITSVLMKFSGLFSDNKDHNDLFVSMKITTNRKERKKKSKRKLQRNKTAGTVPLFGGRGENSFNLAAEQLQREKQRKQR